MIHASGEMKLLNCVSWLIFFAVIVSGTPSFAADDKDVVIAQQGGAAVTYGDIDQFAATIPATDREHFFNDPNRIQSLILGMLLQKQLAMEAVKAGLEPGLDAPKATEEKKQAALAKAEMDHFKAAIKIPDLSVLAREEYLGHPEHYVTPGHTTIKDIFVSNNVRDDAAAKDIAEDVAKRAQDDPATFDSLIDKYSDDPKKAKTHGVLTIAGRTSVDQTVVAAAKQLPLPGSISAPFKVPDGYHVIMMVERVDDSQKTFGEVRESIVSSLKDKFFASRVQEHIDVLRNKPLDANQQSIASLRTRFAKISEAAPEKAFDHAGTKPQNQR